MARRARSREPCKARSSSRWSSESIMSHVARRRSRRTRRDHRAAGGTRARPQCARRFRAHRAGFARAAVRGHPPLVGLLSTVSALARKQAVPGAPCPPGADHLTARTLASVKERENTLRPALDYRAIARRTRLRRSRTAVIEARSVATRFAVRRPGRIGGASIIGDGSPFAGGRQARAVVRCPSAVGSAREQLVTAKGNRHGAGARTPSSVTVRRRAEGRRIGVVAASTEDADADSAEDERHARPVHARIVTSGEEPRNRMLGYAFTAAP